MAVLGEPWSCIIGLWRTTEEVGEAWTMLTAPPGTDVAPYRNRQIVVLPPAEGPRWLDPAVPAREVLTPLPRGSLAVEHAGVTPLPRGEGAQRERWAGEGKAQPRMILP